MIEKLIQTLVRRSQRSGFNPDRGLFLPRPSIANDMPPYYGSPLHKARKKVELHPGLLAETRSSNELAARGRDISMRPRF